MNRRSLVAALGVTLGSGCLRLTGGGNSTPTRTATRSPTRTRTDSPIPTDSPEPTETDTPTETQSETPEGTRAEPAYPLGISDSGVKGYLTGTHRRALSERGFRIRWVMIDTGNSEILRKKIYRVADGLAIGNWTFPEGGEVTAFRGNQGGFWRENLGTEFTYGQSRDGYSIRRVTFSRWLDPIIEQGQWSAPELIRREKPARWRLQITGFSTSETQIGFHNSAKFKQLSGSMVVDEYGIIRNLRAEFTVSTRFGTLQRQITNQIDSVGSVSVTPPSWLSTAKERVPEVSASLTDDRKYVKFRIDSGNELEAETAINVYDETNNKNAFIYELQKPLQKGTTAYLYRDASGRERFTREERPSDASPMTYDGEYHMWADRGALEYFGTVDL